MFDMILCIPLLSFLPFRTHVCQLYRAGFWSVSERTGIKLAGSSLREREKQHCVFRYLETVLCTTILDCLSSTFLFQTLFLGISFVDLSFVGEGWAFVWYGSGYSFGQGPGLGRTEFWERKMLGANRIQMASGWCKSKPIWDSKATKACWSAYWYGDGHFWTVTNEMTFVLLQREDGEGARQTESSSWRRTICVIRRTRGRRKILFSFLCCIGGACCYYRQTDRQQTVDILPLLGASLGGIRKSKISKHNLSVSLAPSELICYW